MSLVYPRAYHIGGLLVLTVILGCAKPVADDTGRTDRAAVSESVEYREVSALEAKQSELVAPRDLAIDPFNGRVWIADPRSGVWIWSPGDGLPQRVGRVGSGPGEYRQPWQVLQAGDSMAVWDASLLQLSTFASDGRPLSQRSLRIAESEHGRVVSLELVRGEPFVWTESRPGTDSDQATSRIWRLGSADTPGVPLLEGAGPETLMLRSEAGFTRFPAPFQKRTLAAFDPDSVIVVVDTSRPELLVYVHAGDLLRTIQLPLEPVPVTEDMRSRYADSIRHGLLQEMETLRYPADLQEHFLGSQERLLRQAEYPDEMQYIDYLTTDGGGLAWLLLSGVGPNYRRDWLVVDLVSSAPLRRVSVPHSANVVGAVVRGDRLHVIEVDMNGIPRVAVYAP